MSAIAAIHVAKKQLGLDDDALRDIYERVTRKRSLRAMSPGEVDRVLAELRKLGFKPISKADEDGFRGRYVPMFQALWLSAWNLGLVEDNSDQALVSFVKRQTGVDHMRWVQDPKDARSAIEGLKAWMKRDAGVQWSVADTGYDRQLAVVEAQLRKLGEPPMDLEPQLDLVRLMKTLGKRIRKAKG